LRSAALKARLYCLPKPTISWKALERIQPEKWITHRFPIERAEEAYRLLDENPQETIQILVTYS